MRNETILVILDHLCNEARNSMHATLGVVELMRDGMGESARGTALSVGRSSADQLLRSIDDVRDLLSDVPAGAPALEDFDLVASVSDIIEALNLVSGRRARHMILEESLEPVLVTHDRKAIEQVLTRILDTAFKLTQTTDIRVKVARVLDEGNARLTLSARDAQLAVRLTRWLNSDPDQVLLPDPVEVPFGIALMVAGKHLRSLRAAAELRRDSAGHSSVVVDLPLRAQGADSETLESSRPDEQVDGLNILVAEDCDDSFFLTELLLENERVLRARDGHEALQMIQKHRFDVVLMDIHMPGMDGYQAIRGMRAWETQTGNAHTPMVILSSDDLATQRQNAAQCGCSGFLRKPLHRAELSPLLSRLKQARLPVT